MDPLRIGVVGCGNISPIYLKNLNDFKGTEVVAIADLDRSRAEDRAKEFGVPKVLSTDELIESDEVELVLNLTIPAAHHELSKRVLQAGKHCYSEKPLAVEREQGRELRDLALEKKLLMGCAPDTVLGAGIQTARKLIDDGAIGKVVGCNMFMMGGGVETWHPNPPFYYSKGGGPMFDMGPYYLSAIVTLLGQIEWVTGMTAISFPVRHITSQPLAGQDVTVETPTHITGLMEFQSGAIGQITTSFDVMAGHTLPNIQIYGEEGSLHVPDPNTFGGPVKLKKRDSEEWEEVPLTHAYEENSRGVAVLDMAHAVRNKGCHRANDWLAYHVLDAMHAFHEAAENHKHVKLQSEAQRPNPMPTEGLE